MSRTHNIANTRVMLPLALALLLVLGNGCSGDCGWGANAQTFVDDNRNGTWDQGESPLSKVRLDVTDRQGNGDYGGWWESDDTGNAYIAFFVTCKRRIEFVLSATPPEGFTPTTPERIDAGSETGQTFTFGFTRER